MRRSCAHRLTSLTVLLAACVDAGLDTETTSRGSILGTADWDSIVAFEQDPTYALGARLGRSVGALMFEFPDGSEGACSAFLIDDEYVVSAYHCYEYWEGLWAAENRSHVGPTARFIPGRYGTSHIEGIVEIGYRLEDLGVERSAARRKAPQILQDGFDCHRDSTYRNYAGDVDDIDLYRCTNDIVVHNQGSRRFVTYIAPGHLVGHMDVAPPAVLSSVTPGDSIYLLSYNRLDLSSGPHGSVLLSPGGIVTSTYRSCVAGRAGACFQSRRDDQVAGSSGGPVLLAGEDLVVGIIQGQNGAETRNSHTHLDASIYDRTQIPPANHPLPSNAISAFTATAGGTGGTLQRLDCPNDYLAQGILTRDATQANGRSVVTTFGLVCIPHDPAQRRLDRAVVVAGGSIDIGLGTSIVEDLSAFEKRHEVSVTMCPDQYYLSGMSVATNQLLEHVFAIACRGPTGHTFTRTSREPIGKYTYPSNIAAVDCGARVVKRLEVRSGWYTDSVRFGCVTAP